MILPSGLTEAMINDARQGFIRAWSEKRPNDHAVIDTCILDDDPFIAALTAALAGRVVVPADPTLKMINAADFHEGMFTSPSMSIEKIYCAMLAAAVEGDA